MSFRETLNRNPRRAALIVGTLVVACIALIGWQTMAGAGNGGGISRFYFTTDDGKTWFPESAEKVPPFEHSGKTAVRIHLFKCGENGRTFVGYLERVNPAALKKAQALSAKGGQAATEVETIRSSGLEVKRPGEPRWVGAYTPAGLALTAPKCPSGDNGPIMPVLP